MISDTLIAHFPAMHRAIRSALYWLQPDDLEDCISEAQLSLLIRAARDDTFTQQTDSYIVQAGVYAARAWATKQRRYAARVMPLFDWLPEASDPVAHLESHVLASQALGRSIGTTRTIALGIMAGLSKKQACELAGVTKQAFTYHRHKLARFALGDSAVTT